MQHQRPFAALVLIVFWWPSASAQISTIHTAGGKEIECVHSGLISDFKDCGLNTDWYAYVFVGSISSITPKGAEKELQIVPEEVFHGEPVNPLIVQTSQGACLPQLRAGDKWLFFLRDSKPVVLDYYGNISRPVADAQQQLETLRRLKALGDNGILRGEVIRGPSYSDSDPIPEAHIVARRTKDNLQFVTTTNAKGRYEFQPLPPGEYVLTVDPIGSFQPDKSAVTVTRGACWDVTLSRSPHTRLAGHVWRSNGSPAGNIPVIVMSEDGSWFTTGNSDANGFFHFDSLSGGKYLVGIHLPGTPAWKIASCGGQCEPPPGLLYYPGVRDRSAALPINLATDEKRKDIELFLPDE